MPTRAAADDTAKAATYELWAMTPPTAGPIRKPTVATMFNVAIALGVERAERTICTWLPVQKKARATPCTAADTTSAAKPDSNTNRPTERPMSTAAVVITSELETTRITEPSCQRVRT